MKTKFMMLLAAMLLSASAFAQSENNEPLKGDVNGDGKVDVADINEIIKIMKEAGGTAETPTYYWYVGQTDPSTMTSISPIVTDNSSSGWREIGTTLPTYTMSNPLWNGQVNEIVFDNYRDVTAYIALPNSDIKVRDGLGNDVTSQMISKGTKTINGVTYTIYQNNLNSNCMTYSLDLLVY